MSWRGFTCHLLLLLAVSAVAFSETSVDPALVLERCTVVRGDLEPRVLLTGEIVAEEAEPLVPQADSLD